ncbi:hypothetical protein [uncultured Ruegeria sp.]|uniref:hypothetical protein n=1 Tax=uncultured Ruegeria sp. TaxID=259304 RepID=UPI00260B6564|nr:hypothetical protein [uncultured Ruegeria sp.]
MGILTNEKYWANVTNKLFELRPAPGTAYDDNQISETLSLICKAMTDLQKDPSFPSDLQSALLKPTPDTVAMADMLDEFERAERKIALDAGVYDQATKDLGRSVRSVQKALRQDFRALSDVQTLGRQIEYTGRLACDAKKDRRLAMESQAGRTRIERTVQATKGVAVISFNAGATAGSTFVNPVLGATSSLLLGWSVRSGAMLVKDAYEGVW